MQRIGKSFEDRQRKQATCTEWPCETMSSHNKSALDSQVFGGEKVGSDRP
jgi:hypothetical protein